MVFDDRDGSRHERVAILFDIDGTLIESGGAGAESWRIAFDELYGVPADINALTDAGMTDPEVGRLTFRKVVGREPTTRELARLLAKRNALLPRTVAESAGYRVLPGVKQLLPRLSEEGYLLGLTTGGVQSAAHIKLERAHLNRYFHFGGYGSDSPDRGDLTRHAIERAAVIVGRPLSQEEALVVGDTPYDIGAAHEADAVGVGVATGHYSKQELAEAGADYVLGSLEEELPL
jgi:phosphoglycolate phosphatase-like HAD superfamily hydrolase